MLMLHNLVKSIRRGPVTGSNPWNGTTLEWKTSSPPPVENFETIPEVTTGPYVYDH